MLKKIGDTYGTLKNTHHHKGVTMLDIYEKYFEDFKNDRFNFLEIGVLDGSSVKTWKNYFPNAHIYGIDIDPRCKAFEESNIVIEIGSQDSQETINNIVKKTDNGKFRIIMDDGSHINKLTIKSFELLYDRLEPGGMYIFEDMICTYSDARSNWPGMSYNNLEDKDIFVNDRTTFNTFINDIISNIDWEKKNMYSLHIYRNFYILIKDK